MLQSLWRGFQEGGWMMFVIVALGFVSMGAAIRFARRGEYQLLGFLRWMLMTQALAGALGFTTGMVLVLHSASRIAQGQQVGDLQSVSHVLTLGTKEALSCVCTSLLFAFLVSALVALGLRRFPSPNPSSLV